MKTNTQIPKNREHGVKMTQVNIVFLQSCVSQSGETRAILARERPSSSRMLLSYAIMILSPVTNEPVESFKQVFQSFAARVQTCLNRVAAITFRLTDQRKTLDNVFVMFSIEYTLKKKDLQIISSSSFMQCANCFFVQWGMKPREVQTLHTSTRLHTPGQILCEEKLDCQIVSEKPQKLLMTGEFSALTKCNATLTELTGAWEFTVEEAISCVCCCSAVLSASQKRCSLFRSELWDVSERC